MKIPTKEMQTRYHTLASGRDDLDILIHDIEINRDNLGYNLYYCKLKKVCIENKYEKFLICIFIIELSKYNIIM